MKQSYHFLFVLFLICFTTKLYSQSVPSYVPTNGLVGWWGFNGNAQDGSGNGNHGTVNGATLTTDRFGNQNEAYNFSGSQSIVINDHVSLRPSLITISAWIYTTLSGDNPIVTKTRIGNPFGVDGGEQYSLFQGSYNTQITTGSFQIKRNGNCVNGGIGWVRITNSDSTFNIGSWQFITASYDGFTMKLFKNSVLIGVHIPSPGSIDNCQGGTLNFGRYWDSNFFNGKIDDIGIWNRALTQQEITNLYNSQLPTQTSLCLPSITTNTPTSIGIDSVIVGGNITNDGGSSIVLRGVCYSTTPNPNMGNMRTEDGAGVGSFSAILRNLNPSTTYYVRSYAKNTNGVVVYGDEVSFYTNTSNGFSSCGGVTDIDGNSYQTVLIGTQCWTQSNLKVSKYRNGDTIPTGLNNSLWASTTVGAYAIYNNDPVSDGLYGKLYNHYAVTDTRGLCPTGWHVPTDGDWNILVKFLDPNADTVCNNCWQSAFAGVALKSTSGWAFGNGYNSSGFTALPGGLRDGGGGFNALGDYGYWWSSSSSMSNAWKRTLTYSIGAIYRNDSFRNYGVSLRCLRD